MITFFRYGSAKFTLNTAMMKKWYELSSKYVYVMQGLRLEGNTYLKSPCKSGISRWRIYAGACPSGETDWAGNGWDTTKTAIVTAITSSSDVNNPNVIDVDIRATGCLPGECKYSVCDDDVALAGAKVKIADKCYEHVHPNLFDIVDASYWVIGHPGNDRTRGFFPIKVPAVTGTFQLRFPASHDMTNRWAWYESWPGAERVETEGERQRKRE